MKYFFSLIIILFLTQVSAQNTLDELKNSIERSKGGSGAKVEYVVRLTPSNIKSYYAKDFDSGKLIEKDGKPLFFELSKKEGENLETVLINLESASIIELSITYPKGNCTYKFEFFY